MSKLEKVAAQARMVALAAPCEFAEQCYNARYFFDCHPLQQLYVRVGLTVNVGEE